MIREIQTKNLASGDIVYFPRIGKRKFLRLTADYSSIGSRSVFFDDCKMRSLKTDAFVKAEIAPEIPALRDGEIYRYDRASQRTSIISGGAFMRGFSDVSDSFMQLPARVRTPTTSLLLDEIVRGAVLHTADAIYSMSIKSFSTIV